MEWVEDCKLRRDYMAVIYSRNALGVCEQERTGM